MHPSRCPHCGKPCLGFWAKTSLGPAHKRLCRSCGKPVSVPWLWALPFFFVAGPISTIGGLYLVVLCGNLVPTGWFFPAFIADCFISALPLIWLYHLFVPLVPRSA